MTLIHVLNGYILITNELINWIYFYFNIVLFEKMKIVVTLKTGDCRAKSAEFRLHEQ